MAPVVEATDRDDDDDDDARDTTARRTVRGICCDRDRDRAAAAAVDWRQTMSELGEAMIESAVFGDSAGDGSGSGGQIPFSFGSGKESWWLTTNSGRRASRNESLAGSWFGRKIRTVSGRCQGLWLCEAFGGPYQFC